MSHPSLSKHRPHNNSPNKYQTRIQQQSTATNTCMIIITVYRVKKIIALSIKPWNWWAIKLSFTQKNQLEITKKYKYYQKQGKKDHVQNKQMQIKDNKTKIFNIWQIKLNTFQQIPPFPYKKIKRPMGHIAHLRNFFFFTCFQYQFTN